MFNYKIQLEYILKQRNEEANGGYIRVWGMGIIRLFLKRILVWMGRIQRNLNIV
jgi:hypothetical protein